MKIVTDSAAQMTSAELQALGVAEAPMTINFPDGEINSSEITPDDFYNRLKAIYPVIPTTAQPSSGVFADIYRRVAESDKQVLSIHISSGLSGTWQAAQLGATDVTPEIDVTTWDTLTLSGGERFQVLAAAQAARAGWTMPAIQQRLADIRAKTEVVFTLETLDYLARGGRIGRVQALAGSLLKIKPVIRVEHADGKYSTVTKSRNISQALTVISDHLHGLYGNMPVWVITLHGQFAEQANTLADRLIDKLTIAKLETLRVTPVLGVHTGPGIVGAAVVPMSLVEDLLPG